MTAVLVAGALAARWGNSGGAWVRLSWVIGLAELGCDVWFVEQLLQESSEGVNWFATISEEYQLKSSLLNGTGASIAGRGQRDLLHFARDCDLLINISGNLRDRRLLNACRRKAFIDLDPGYTQSWIEAGLDAGATDHDAYFSVAVNLGRSGCSLPTAGLEWLPVRQPTVLRHWPLALGPDDDLFTTVTTWRSPFGRLQIGDHAFGMKTHEFRKLAELPRITGARFEVATNIDSADHADQARLEDGGWMVSPANVVCRNPRDFRAFIQRSGAEVSPVQPVYAQTRSGWFSDRSVRYLASGKPVLVQDTGLEGDLSSQGGLVTFTDLRTAAAGVRNIQRNYATHSAAARELAETCFAAEVVLPEFLERAGLS